MEPTYNEEQFEEYKHEIAKFGFGSECIDDDFKLPDGSYGDEHSTLLANLLGFTGTNNFDDEDVYDVLLTLSKIKENPKYNNDTAQELLAYILELPERYVNLILCVLHDASYWYEDKRFEIINYGTRLQLCWIDDVGKMIIKTREFDLIRLRHACS